MEKSTSSLDPCGAGSDPSQARRRRAAGQLGHQQLPWRLPWAETVSRHSKTQKTRPLFGLTESLQGIHAAHAHAPNLNSIPNLAPLNSILPKMHIKRPVPNQYHLPAKGEQQPSTQDMEDRLLARLHPSLLDLCALTVRLDGIPPGEAERGTPQVEV